MSSPDARNEALFSYGTLQREPIQLATFGRKLEGRPDVLNGYRLGQVEIQDHEVIAASGETHYRNLEPTGAVSDCVEGTVFMLTFRELERSDEYEAEADYRRIRVELKSGITAWVYLHRT
ncbi:MAG TPA: gamma-glutamylcyclotransferase family protein [Candidatus Polarisedimenticolia bacterium]|nr:gamma-glutamylcyclotransferase family protein [Candidatus Polarisedimenticolia bacterium]